jgi:putative transposase
LNPLCATRVSPSTVSALNQKIYGTIEEWRSRPIEGRFVYVYLDGLYLKRSWGGEVRNVAVLVAIGVDAEGFRSILGVMEGAKEDKASWLAFVRHLKERGLCGTELFISDRCLGLVESVSECFPEARWQRCIVHFYRNVFSLVPSGKVKEVAAMLKAIHAQEDRKEALAKIEAVAAKLTLMKLGKASELVRSSAQETLTYYDFPREHWRRIRTNNPMERVMREIRRRTRVVGAFPDGRSALMLVAARLRHVAGTRWGLRRYPDMSHLARDAATGTEAAAAAG